MKNLFKEVKKLDPQGESPNDFFITFDELQILLGATPEKDENDQGPGHSSFGRLYKHPLDGKPVAVKTVTIRYVNGETFREELKTVYEVGNQSEHLVHLEKCCLLEPTRAYLVTKWMSQGSLYDLLQKGEKFSWRRRFDIAVGIIKGLITLHKNNILHESLYSWNVLLDNNSVKLSDFGFPQTKLSMSYITALMDGQLQRFKRQAPEQTDQKIQKPAEIYSFGMILWELTTGAEPFTQATNLIKILNLKVSKTSENIPKNCPQAWQNLIERCWNPEAAQRPTADAILDYLLKYEKDITQYVEPSAGSQQELGEQKPGKNPYASFGTPVKPDPAIQKPPGGPSFK